MSDPESKAVDQHGVILIVGALSLMGVMIIAGMVFDLGRWFVARGELQLVADTAALAGGRALGALYAGGELEGFPQSPLSRKIHQVQQTLQISPTDVTFIEDVVNASVAPQQVDGQSISIDPGDIEIGLWDYDTGVNVFTPGTATPNAVRVSAQLDSSNAITTIFGGLLNIDSIQVPSVSSIAALTPLSSVPPNNRLDAVPPNSLPAGEIQFPIGLSRAFGGGDVCSAPCTAPGAFCDLIVADTSPTCAAWNTFDRDDGAQGTLDIVGITGRTITSPETSIGDSYNFWGNASQQRVNLTNLFGLLLGGAGQIETLLPVYQDTDCTAPTTGAVPIVGFVNARIVANPGAASPNFLIQYLCNVVSTGRSGGTQPQDFGTLGSIPVLVQ